MPLDDAAKFKWKRVQARLKAAVGEEAYSSWLASLQLEEIVETVFYCSVPTSFLKHWIEKHYAKNVIDCITLEWPEAAKVYILQRTVGQPVIIPDLKKTPEKDELLGGTKQMPMESQDPDGTLLKSNCVDGGMPNHDEATEDQEVEEDQSEAAELLPPQQSEPDRPIYLKDIIKYACLHYKLARVLMLSSKRDRLTVRPRQIGMFLSKFMTDRSLPEIGRRFGGRDHTTVLHSVRRVQELVLNDIEFAFEVASLEAAIRHRQLA